MPPKNLFDSDEEENSQGPRQPRGKVAPPSLMDDDDAESNSAARRKPKSLYSDDDDDDGNSQKKGGAPQPKPKAVPRVIPKVASPNSAAESQPLAEGATPPPSFPPQQQQQQGPPPVQQQPIVQQQQPPQQQQQAAPQGYPPANFQNQQQPQPHAPAFPPQQQQQPAGYPTQQPPQQFGGQGYPPQQQQQQQFQNQPHQQYPLQQQQQQQPAGYPPQGQQQPAQGYPPQPQQQFPQQQQQAAGYPPLQQQQPAAAPPPKPEPKDLPKPPMPKPPSLPLEGSPEPLPAFKNVVPEMEQKAAIDNTAWEAFQQLRKQLEESHSRTTTLHAQISQLQLSHEKEAQEFREASKQQQEVLRKEWETVTEHYNQAQAKVDNMTSILNRNAEQIMKKDQQIHELHAANAAMAQTVAHVEDRAKLADNARQVAEVRQRELELSLDHSVDLVNSLRKQLGVAHEEKVIALQNQYSTFEANREEVVKFYADREEKLLQGYNESLNAVQLHMEANIKEREDKASKFWQETLASQEAQYKDLEKEFLSRQSQHETEMNTLKEKQEEEKEKWTRHLKQEVYQLEQRQKEREEHVLADIARRERELSEREQRTRVQRVQDEQDAKVALLSKEAEMKAYYEKQMEDMRRGHEMDRDRLTSAFREQLAAISSQHLASERDLEKLHRDKEREMAQRYRVAGYEAEDSKSMTSLKDVTQKTQSSLLARFDTVEARQRERAEQSRSALKSSTSLSNVATTPSSTAPATPALGAGTAAGSGK